MYHSKLLHKKGLIRNIKMLTQSQLSQIKFSATLNNVKEFFGPLKAINFDETATFVISKNGLLVTVENSNVVQASVYVSHKYFTEFNIHLGNDDDSLIFSINLNVITDCLSIFSNVESNLKMIYKGFGAPLILVLEHHGDNEVITECSIKTKNSNETIEYSFDEDSPNYNCVVLRGPELSNIFNEIDKSAEELEISMSPDSPYFRIRTIGVMQAQTSIEIAKTSDMISIYSCKSSTCARYKMSNIKLIIKSIFLSSKVAIRTDSNGLLGFQFMISCDDSDSAQIHIEFFITPLITCNDDDND